MATAEHSIRSLLTGRDRLEAAELVIELEDHLDKTGDATWSCYHTSSAYMRMAYDMSLVCWVAPGLR